MKLPVVVNHLCFEGNREVVKRLLHHVANPAIKQVFSYYRIAWASENVNTRKIHWGTEYEVVSSCYTENMIQVETLVIPITSKILEALSKSYPSLRIIHMMHAADGAKCKSVWKAGKEFERKRNTSSAAPPQKEIEVELPKPDRTVKKPRAAKKTNSASNSTKLF